ncbi:epoxide hydrolase-like protein [Dothidotthia symphoricarpi CBS 119687]|uniref:Epoxide hydrolase-like protein n=1 Tax=Dothidotthia symphoricarpi CBS 119687 TaxID=1392245 RepID=A0A6A6A491_9PLEO|nr:epoxide hydrolase-like protein [Dothidotthia symphoricarpi CBS 119687]KAF2125995.1 epoxide hydrolase-like protein [Dothidotthia symphoricarpi CBS 119687]
MTVEPINPGNDARVQHKTAVLNGQTYQYLYAVPKSGEWRDTVFLIHGWPDLSMGWRYQIPFLVDLGFRVVAPDMMGYGGTDAPQAPPNPINLYGLKRASDDIAALAKEVDAPTIILGGHDWGGFVIWRAAAYHPKLITHIFSVCTPYSAPSEQYISTEDLVKGPLPQFAYQLHLASGEVEKSVRDETSIRQFLKGMYGARGPGGEVVFDPAKGVVGENLPLVGESRLLGGEVLEYYVAQYVRHGIHPTCSSPPPLLSLIQHVSPLTPSPIIVNWYRTRHANWEEDKSLLDKKTINQPTLFIQATQDSVLKPEMSRGMEALVPQLTRGEVAASHWALTQTPAEVNEILGKWLEGQGLVGEGKAGKSSL